MSISSKAPPSPPAAQRSGRRSSSRSGRPPPPPRTGSTRRFAVLSDDDNDADSNPQVERAAIRSPPPAKSHAPPPAPHHSHWHGQHCPIDESQSHIHESWMDVDDMKQPSLQRSHLNLFNIVEEESQETSLDDMSETIPTSSTTTDLSTSTSGIKQELEHTASDIACYNSNSYEIFSHLQTVTTHLLKDQSNLKIMDKLLGFEGVLDFLHLLGYESDDKGSKIVCKKKPDKPVVESAMQIIDRYQTRMSIVRYSIASSDTEQKQTNEVNLYDDQQEQPDFVKLNESLSLEQIVIWSTHENVHDEHTMDLMDTLIVTHKQFTNSVTLFRHLRRRFNSAIPEHVQAAEHQTKGHSPVDTYSPRLVFEHAIELDDEDEEEEEEEEEAAYESPRNAALLQRQKVIQLKVFKSLLDWMESCWLDDFEGNNQLNKELNAWMAELEQLQYTKLKKQCLWLKPLLDTVVKTTAKSKFVSETLRKQLAEKAINPETGVPRYLENVEIKILKRGYKLSSVTADELANQITWMNFKVFSSIQARECIGQNWKKQRKEEWSPNILLMIQQFNNLVTFVQLQILLESSLKDRAKEIKLMIQMGERMRKLKNYNGLCAVMNALNSSSIFRLKLAWQKVPDKLVNQFKAFKDVFKNTRNFRNYRSVFRNVAPPAIPYFGLFLQDLMFIDEGNDGYEKVKIALDDDGQTDEKKEEKQDAEPESLVVNFNKYVRTMDRIRNIQTYQQVGYESVCKENPQLQRLLYQQFHAVKEFTQDTIWEMSDQAVSIDEKCAAPLISFSSFMAAMPTSAPTLSPSVSETK
eukprot:CAMPEP_0197050808 /NCGR_PEP_ID=MMETSP1384-20130603/25624_1 /TAXON_ID=29189 /ORGANISM="Ammonia sp." /LENGTH=804 /DNA_ID=CAMNT_0042483269 /DNA_START=16 /DNA_END=2430 /DNA_ORIENTATION=-